MNKLNKRTVVGMFILCVVLCASIVYGEMFRVPGKALSLQEMENILGGVEVEDTNCQSAGQVCGFGSEGYGDACFSNSPTSCNNTPGSGINCTVNPLHVRWKCSTTFTDRYTCQCEPNSTCDTTGGGSIDCGNAYVCAGGQCDCVGYTTCVLDSVTLCVGIPYVTQCGQYNTCE